MAPTDSTAAPQPNRLAQETSPYLLQHANNPVDWYPWGPEALQKAQDEGKPIFLSIGYSACHWCHVMAHESFENPATAAVMNEHFVNIKVDREERPDLDNIYQAAYQLLANRGGGWPLSMFLTPDLGPFWGGTYFPDVDRYGMPAFKDVLLGVVHHFNDKPTDVIHNVNALVQGLAKMNYTGSTDRALSDGLLEAAAQGLMQAFDPVWGGFGEAPKFPSTMALSFLAMRWHRVGVKGYRHAVSHSLSKMAEGGIRDHLGGGFARYSVDERWLVPHFEKMLYDNAQLIPLYIDAYTLGGDESFARVAKEALEYVDREMTAPEGGFYAAQDADSEGEEGRFFVWRPGEIDELLGDDSALFCAYYGVTEMGNFEDQNILCTPEPLAEVASEFGKSEAEAEVILAAGRAKLLARRGDRVWPGRDDKVITSWNGLMVSAFAKAAQVFGEPEYLDTACRAAEFLTTTLMPKSGLLRCYKDGRARFDAYLDDYAFLAQGLLDLYHASGDTAHLNAAKRLVETVQTQFAAQGGGFYFTGKDHEEMISRTFSGQDQSIPSGNGVMANLLVRLHHLTGEAAYLEAAEATVRRFLDAAAMSPLGYASMLLAADALIHPPTTVALVAKASDAEADRWQQALAGRYLPGVYIQRLVDGADDDVAPWLAGKQAVDGQATAYVCRVGTCSAPITDWAVLDVQLAATVSD